MPNRDDLAGPEAAKATAYAGHLPGEFARRGMRTFSGYGVANNRARGHAHPRHEELHQECNVAGLCEGVREIQIGSIARQISRKQPAG
jgi:alkylation response protein AidB-like acyl-CoA dehydrogenase